MTTDNTHDLEDALRALKDRPSLEAELAELRDEANRNWIAFVNHRGDNIRLQAELTDLTGKCIAVTDERDDLRREVERLKAVWDDALGTTT
jgi:chromosome segregation ATPase